MAGRGRGAAGSTRVDAYLDFIDAVMEEEPEPGAEGWADFGGDEKDATGSLGLTEEKSGCVVGASSAGRVGFFMALVGLFGLSGRRFPAGAASHH